MLIMSKNKPTQNNDQVDVDMNKIKDLMGPLPDEPIDTVQLKKPTKKSESLAEAAEEANEALRKLDPELGESEIQTIEDTEESMVDSPAEPIDIETEVQTVAGEVPEDVLDDPVTEEAVDEIVAEEGDVVLKVEDEKLKNLNAPKSEKSFSLKKKIKSFWAKKRNRWVVFVTSIICILALSLIPVTRYFVLNTVGIRASLNVKIVDSSTLLPLKNVEVNVGGINVATDEKGIASLNKVKLGKTRLSVTKRAFESYSKEITVGLGSNPIGEVSLKATGSQYVILVSDYLSGKPIEGVNAISGDANAVSDKEGKIVLTVDTTDKKDDEILNVELKLDGLRAEKIEVKVSSKDSQKITMVTSRKHVFVSKKSGKFDVYSIDLDGKNEKKLISGTGLERDDISLLPDKTGSYVAYVATRENVKNSDGYLLSTLYLIDVAEGELIKIDQSEQIQLVGWSSDSRVSYVKIVAGTSASNPNRTKIFSVLASKISEKKELASANYFNDVAMYLNKIYYVPGNESQASPKPGLYSVQSDGTAKLTILDKPIWNMYRSSYDTLMLNSNNTWYIHKIGTSSASTNDALATSTNRVYFDSNDQKSSVWVDQRDGKGVLLIYDVAKKSEEQLISKVGLKTPLYWLDANTVVYRQNDSKEIADYAVSIKGGEPKKLASVTNTTGFDRWFYY